jgi:fused signal recognition particle receptor
MGLAEFQLAILGLLAASAVVALGAGAIGVVRMFRAEPPAPALPAPAAVPERAPVEVEAPPEPEALPAPPPIDLRRGLRKTRTAFIGRLADLLRGREVLDAATLEDLESLLFGADLGVATADHLLEAARTAGSPAAVHDALRVAALDILQGVQTGEPRRGAPHVVLVVGVNGSGKTTSIGKLAMRYRRAGQKVLLGAADTFRAAAIDQLAIWAERAGAEIVRGEPGGDPAAVAYDAVQAARARDMDVVILDTAGRLQTDNALMAELEKISRVIKKEIPDAPHEVLLVLDANTGQNAIRQAQEFGRAVQVDHIVLAKLDGTAKGGVVLGIAQEVGLPVRYIGVGEAIDDLADFDPEAFVDALFTPDS